MPKECCNSPACQNRTRLIKHTDSIPHIPLVPFEAVGLEEAAVFVLEGVFGVVLFLVGDVGADVVGFGFADGEDAVTGLPVELGEHGIALRLVDEPDGGGAFHFFDPVRHRDRASEAHEDVNVIRHAADDQRRAIESRGDAAKVAMEFVAQGFVGEKGKTILRGPNRVNEDVREGLGHGGKDSERANDSSIRQFCASNREAVPSCSPGVDAQRPLLGNEVHTPQFGIWTTTRSRHAAQGCRALARLPWVSRATPPRSHSWTATRSRHAGFRPHRPSNCEAVPSCSPGVDAKRPLLGHAVYTPHSVLDHNVVLSCSPRVPSLGEAPLGFACHTAPIPFPDRHAVPSGGVSWVWGRSGDGTSLRFMIRRGIGGGAGFPGEPR